MNILRKLFLILLLVFTSNFSNAVDVRVLSLKGYLGEEVLKTANATLEDVKKDTHLILELDSTSGDLTKVLNVAKKIYQLKNEGLVKVTVYIEDNAIGPAAVFPFLGDTLYISPFVLWGDIPLGTEEALPTNLLRSRVSSLITKGGKHESILTTISAAMIDPNLVVTLDSTLRLSYEGQGSLENIVSNKGQTLVLNHNQILSLGLAEKTYTSREFRSHMGLTRQQQEGLEIRSSDYNSMEVNQLNFDEQLAKYIKLSKTENNTIGYISIDDRTNPISQSTWIYIKTALDYYKKEKPAFIILMLNTPGGEVFASQKISDLLKEMDTQHNIPVITFIDNWAISAGAMLAYSCRFITSVKDGSMGAAEPVLMGEGGQMQSASEKVNSALRTDFGNRAQFFDRNPNIAKAMVDKDIILVLRHGKIVKLDKEEQIRYKGTDPDVVITNKGKLLTLNAEEMVRYGVANAVIPTKKVVPITDAEKTAGKWSFSKEQLSGYPFFTEFSEATVDAYQMDWRTRFFSVLAMPSVASLLMLGLLVGFYLEFNTPGFGLPGAVGLTCLVLIIISNLSLEIANLLELIFLLIGVGLIIIEFSILPTGGFLGLVGAVFFIGGLFAMMLPGIGSIDYEFDTQTFNAAGENFVMRLAWFSGTIVVAFGVIAILAQYVTPSLAGLNRFVLSGHEQSADEGFIAGDNPYTLPQPGEKGVVIATLRPAGKVEINQRIYDAVTAGGYIEKGEGILIEKLDGSVIVVSRDSEGKSS
ncbi:MAG: NfeD family protein [Chlamydiota bacterium]|nr:NfeD family protein [Chlamydiota bacterium]